MSTTIHETLIRSVPVVELEMTKSGELEAIFVPWDKPSTVYDPGEEPYDEGFRRGAFDLQIRRPGFSPATIPLLPRHGSSETFGHARALEDVAEGLRGVVAIRPSLREDVAQMVADGIDSMSIEFHALQRAGRVFADGVRWRTAAILTAVAMTAKPAYVDAKVLAMRADDELADMERRAVFAELDRDIEEMRAAGERWKAASQ